MTIDRHVLEDVLAHAREDAPRECCGILLGCAGRIVAHVRAANLEPGTTRFLIDPRDHLQAIRQARARKLDVVGFYHSHPASRPYPSETDVSEAVYPDAVHLIVGAVEAGLAARLFSIDPPAITQLPLSIDDGRGYSDNPDPSPNLQSDI